MVKFFSSARSAMEYLGLEYPAEWQKVEAVYPVVLNSYYLDLIDRSNFWHDPIALQAFPALAELSDTTSSFDPLSEENQMPVERLICRFRDRAVLLATGNCAMRCRFCFRKREWANGHYLAALSDAELEKVCSYLQENPRIREVLVSGGDPLMLPFPRLLKILRALSAVDSIEILRLASRIPVVWPQRITGELCEELSSIPGLWLATHFNHPAELTAEAREACCKFIRTGIPIINQTVLLKNVNDNSDTLEKLFRTLVSWKVKPHYLFHVDPVRGVRHFATGIECGLNILRDFRPRLSSLAVPTFAIDLPQGGGKVALQPQYESNGRFPAINNDFWVEYPDR